MYFTPLMHGITSKQTHPKFGPWLNVAGFSTVGALLGPISYTNTFKEKLLKSIKPPERFEGSYLGGSAVTYDVLMKRNRDTHRRLPYQDLPLFNSMIEPNAISNILGRRTKNPSAAPAKQPNQGTNNDEQGLMDIETNFRNPRQPTTDMEIFGQNKI